MDPITKEMDNKPFKAFMVNQLQIAFERDRIILSPYDEVLFKQLIDYEVVKTSKTGTPQYTSKDEHFVDALGLAHLAMVMEFKELTGVVEDVKTTSEFFVSNKQMGGPGLYTTSSNRITTDPRILDFYANND